MRSIATDSLNSLPMSLGGYHKVFVVILLPLATFLAYCIYQVYFHPLRKYPGPFLAKLTEWRAGYFALTGDLHIDMWRCHQRYGPVVRYGPDRLLFNTSKAASDIYGPSRNVAKSPTYGGLVHRAPNTFTALDPELHARKRRLLSPAFSDKAIRIYADRILSHANRLCEAIESHFPKNAREGSAVSTLPMDMAKWCDYLGFDIMMDLVFGTQTSLIEGSGDREITSAIEASNVRLSVILWCKALYLGRLDKVLFPKSIEGRNKFIRFVTQVVEERIARAKSTGGIDTPDIFEMMRTSSAAGNDSLASFQELAAECTTLIIAGSDTTSTALSGFFFYMSRNPEAFVTAAREVRTAFAQQADIRPGTELNKCIFLRACLDESMRMAPPVGSSLWREVKTGGAVIDGNYIPAKYEVGCGIHSLHHNCVDYPHPHAFMPERWIHEGIGHPNAAYHPFSAGPRSCIGKGLAYAELMLTTAVVLWKFDLRPACGPEGDIGGGDSTWSEGRRNGCEYQLYDHVTSAKHGPVLQFKRRI